MADENSSTQPASVSAEDAVAESSERASPTSRGEALAPLEAPATSQDLAPPSLVDGSRPEAKSQEQSGGQIFISYRVSTDERIADALKKFIETGIDPQPKVFVSGLGGLRPSNRGAIPQLQGAAHGAKAFVGIITKASLAREWIFFEAGAAWGQKLLYAPLLIDTKPEELPNTIGDYQATPANDREKMFVLLTELANAVGGAIKGNRGHFNKRYGNFERAINPDAEADEAENEAPRPASIAPDTALQLLMDGRKEEADVAFDKLEEQAGADRQKLANLKLMRIVWDKTVKPHEVRARLEKLPPEAKDLPDYHYWLARYESRRHVRIDHAKRCLELDPDELTRRVVILDLDESYRALGRNDDSRRVLRRALVDVDHDLRREAALRLQRPMFSSPVGAKLLLGCLAIAYSSPDDLAKTSRSAIEMLGRQELVPLSIFIARWWERHASDANSALWEGIVLASAGLKSLAYLAYERAATAGVSVAKVNMAALLGTGSVPSAGLALYERHTGVFGAASQDMPYRMRATLEAQVQSEREKAERWELSGARLYNMLIELGERAAVACEPPRQITGAYVRDSERFSCASREDGALQFLTSDGSPKARKSFTLRRGLPFENVWVDRQGDNKHRILVVAEDGTLSGIRIDVDSNGELLSVWETFSPKATPAKVG